MWFQGRLIDIPNGVSSRSLGSNDVPEANAMLGGVNFLPLSNPSLQPDGNNHNSIHGQEIIG